ncbi:MAG: DUF1775 domain-containing protein [Candidatus Cybelea sp.]
MMIRRSALIAALMAFWIPISIAAHVRVFPDSENTQASACSFDTFIVRVPVERLAATVRVDVAVPKGVIVYAVQPKPPWHFDLQTTKGLVTRISWSGGHLMPHEFDEFAFLAATPKQPGTLNWDAWQYYDDGTIVSWTGPTNADTPHSITTIVPGRCKSTKKTR